MLCSAFGIAARINKDCSKSMVITLHAVSHSSTSVKGFKIVLVVLGFRESLDRKKVCQMEGWESLNELKDH